MISRETTDKETANYIRRYVGMSYEQASREASAMLVEAAATGYWFFLPERLIMFRDIMTHGWGRPATPEEVGMLVENRASGNYVCIENPAQ